MTWFRCGGGSGGSADLLELMTGPNTFDLDDQTIKTKATSIPQYCFYDNRNIRHVELNDIESVGDRAFAESRIDRVILPNCETIEQYAFYNTKNNGVTFVGNEFPKVKTIGSYAFSGSNMGDDFEFPECITIASNAFRAMRANSFYLPKVQTIGDNGLGFNVITVDIDLPEIVTLGNQVFRSWNVQNVKLGPNLTSIGTMLFYSARVVNLYIYALTPPTLAGNIDASATTLTNIFVPASVVEDYKTANRWSNAAAKIQAIPEE